MAASNVPQDSESEPAQPQQKVTAQAKPELQQQSDPAPEQKPSVRLNPEFDRSAKPIKSETTAEIFKNVRVREQATEAPAETMHYVVWEVDLGARIYRVPEAKLATVGKQPHAGKLTLFDSLDKAKAEANAIFKRVATDRSEKGLSRSILEPTLEDLMRWDENNVPDYFL